MKKITVTLTEQQVSLVLGMIWHGENLGIFDESEDTLVAETKAAFEDMENEMFLGVLSDE